jgi:polar amino acid transport system substrate-binding protein
MDMKNILAGLILSLLALTVSSAPIAPTEDQSTLKVGIIPFTEPFVMQASTNEYYGFDISTMESVCKAIQKKCRYIPVKRSEINSAFDNDEIDLAIGDFVINVTMQEYVDFSIPYMISQAQFIGLQSNSNVRLDPDGIQKMRIGVILNSAYAAALSGMKIPADQINTFETDTDIIAALEAHQIDVGFINHYIANYWQHSSGGLVMPIGTPVNVGFGLAFVLSPKRFDLMIPINAAIYNYQNSNDFKNNYNVYLTNFQ